MGQYYQNSPRTPESEGGASHRITQTRPAGVQETAPVMATGRKVTNKRQSAPGRSAAFNAVVAAGRDAYRDIGTYGGTR